MKQRIAAVVVTFNRLTLLQQCINALQSQTKPPDEIIVVNNGSTDATADWLSIQKNITVITQPNAGSSGGQYTGIQYAINNNFDWTWCMDDDTIASENALQQLTSSNYFNDTSSFLCSTVLWKDDTLHKMNRPLLMAGYYEEAFHANLPSSEVIYCSFVSILINTKAVKVAGYPLKKMFIWYDDLEYTIRLRKYGPGYTIGNSIVYHKTEKNTGPDFLPKDRRLNNKELLGVRNYFFIRKRIYPYHKNKWKHLYQYAKSSGSILKYAIKTGQVNTIFSAAIKGIIMNGKQN